MSAIERPLPTLTSAPPTSNLGVGVVLGVFAVGIALGGTSYLHRSLIPIKHVAGTNAIALHIAIAVVALAVIVGTRVKRSHSGRQPRHGLWTTPLAENSVSRFRRTMGLANGVSFWNLVRIPVSLILLLVMMYWPFRMGQQLIGHLDPNSNVNAWGGPTYVGALLAHWLDCILAFYFSAFLLSKVCLKPSAPAAQRSEVQSLV